MRSGNPALSEDTFRKFRWRQNDLDSSMTLNGTVWKTAIMLALVVLSAFLTWMQPAGQWPVLTIFGALAGFVFALIIIFNQRTAPVLAPIYALLEGMAVGGISAITEGQYPGVVIPAVMLTFGTLGALLIAYTTRLIRPSENFKLGVVAATGAICLVYLADLFLGFFGINIPGIHEGGVLGITVSLVIVVVAALNLVLDFDFIEEGVKNRTPKYMEWYGAFGLIVTLVWLYLEVLRLLAKVQGGSKN